MTIEQSLLEQSASLAKLGEAIMTDYITVRANTLKLAPEQRPQFADAVLRHWHGGMSHEQALQQAQKEVGK